MLTTSRTVPWKGLGGLNGHRDREQELLEAALWEQCSV